VNDYYALSVIDEMVAPLEIWGPSNGDYRYFNKAPVTTPKKIYNGACTHHMAINPWPSCNTSLLATSGYKPSK